MLNGRVKLCSYILQYYYKIFIGTGRSDSLTSQMKNSPRNIHFQTFPAIYAELFFLFILISHNWDSADWVKFFIKAFLFTSPATLFQLLDSTYVAPARSRCVIAPFLTPRAHIFTLFPSDSGPLVGIYVRVG